MNEETKNKLEVEIKEVEYFIEKSPKTDDYTLALKKNGKKQYILSKYKPREQAIKQIGNDWGNKSTVWVLIGYGFGYMTEVILDKVGLNTQIIIIEPNQELLKKQMELYPIKKEATNVNVILTDNMTQIREQLSNLIPLIEMNNISIRYLEGYLEFYMEFCIQITQLLKEVKIDLEFNFYTTLGRRDDFNLNTLKNARYISENYDMKYLCNICKDIPALIVCAGPSLERSIDEIKNFKGIIIAIGRTMTPLFKRGIRPDFVVSASPPDIIYETFGEYKEHDVPLVTLMQSNAKVVASSHGEKYFMLNNPITTQIFKTHVNPQTNAFNSVSTLCLSFAEFIGCNPIIITGQDLAFTKNKHYASDTKEIESQKIPNEVMTIDWNGKPIKSCEGYVSIMRWMELQIREYPNIVHINASEGGAYIDGMLHMSLDKAIKDYCIKDKPEITHKRLKESKEIDYEKCMRDTKNSLEKILRLSNMLVSYYRQLETEYIKKDKINWNKINQLLDKVNKVDKNIQRIPNSQNLINLLLEVVEMVLETDNANKEKINETNEEKNIRISHFLSEKYEYLTKECENFIRLIDIAMAYK